ncbi:hypothetical protein AB1L30_12290 [Bremerella sp. JC817]|uniref:SPW repeat domain-containing protein n=1 Tax=Bremerella sp. JC817 TaxID=3231756 RepID=UPI00345A360C
MWARVAEFMLGCWLLCSPFIFPEEHRGAVPALVDFSLGGMVMTFALLSYWRPTRFAHIGTLFLSLAIILLARIMLAPEIPPSGQNFMMIGLLLLMFSMVPNKAFDAPEAWQRWLSESSGERPTI